MCTWKNRKRAYIPASSDVTCFTVDTPPEEDDGSLSGDQTVAVCVSLPAWSLTQSEAESADQAEQKQLPDLLQALQERAEAAALSQLLPQQQPGGQLHPFSNLTWAQRKFSLVSQTWDCFLVFLC